MHGSINRTLSDIGVYLCYMFPAIVHVMFYGFTVTDHLIVDLPRLKTRNELNRIESN